MTDDPAGVPALDIDTPIDAGDTAPAFEEFGDPAGAGATMAGNASLAAVGDVPVRVQAVLGRARLPVGDLLRMRAGTVIELDRRVGEPVEVFVNNRLVARGEVMLVDQALGVTLTEIVRQGS